MTNRLNINSTSSPSSNKPPRRFPKPGLPSIYVTGRRLRDLTSAALKALEQANDPPMLFVRGLRIVRILADPETGRPRIEALSDAALKGHLERTVNFVGGSQRTPVDPPHNVIADIQALGVWPFPTLVNLVEVPIVRPDGTILDRTGYDATTALYYWKSPALRIPPIPEQPLPQDVANAVRLLEEELICDFRFDSQASRANAIGTLLTSVIRSAIDGQVPIGVIDATQPGSGKGLLAAVVAVLATGHAPAIMTAPNNTEEWRRQITATLASGAPLILIDNIEGRLDSPILAAALTTPLWRDRILGRIEMIELPQRATWLANGNNVRVGGDMQRRCFWIRLDPQMSRPWERSAFRHPDLLGWVKQNRGGLIGALLVLTRAWYAAGQPPALTPVIGSFENWSRTVGGILSNAGIPGFLENLDSFYDTADDETAEWEEFYTRLDLIMQSKPFLASDVSQALETDSALQDALPEELAEAWGRRHQGASVTKSLGQSFKRRVGRRYGKDEYRIEKDGKVHGAQRWRVGKTVR